MDQQHSTRDVSTVTLTGVIITLGIVYGDLGTSPLYTMQAIVGGLTSLDTLWVIGSLSCIIWTLTLQTTVKYIIITLKADNKGEGGIFALFALIRKKAPWTYILAIVGGSALLADGIMDAACRPIYIDRIQHYMPNSQRLLFANMAHMVGNRYFDQLLARFLNNPLEKLVSAQSDVIAY